MSNENEQNLVANDVDQYKNELAPKEVGLSFFQRLSKKIYEWRETFVIRFRIWRMFSHIKGEIAKSNEMISDQRLKKKTDLSSYAKAYENWSTLSRFSGLNYQLHLFRWALVMVEPNSNPIEFPLRDIDEIDIQETGNIYTTQQLTTPVISDYQYIKTKVHDGREYRLTVRTIQGGWIQVCSKEQSLYHFVEELKSAKKSYNFEETEISQTRRNYEEIKNNIMKSTYGVPRLEEKIAELVAIRSRAKKALKDKSIDLSHIRDTLGTEISENENLFNKSTPQVNVIDKP
jgi:hypothetical protein